MRLVYLTGKRFPATTADHHYIRFLAQAFARVMDDQFELVIAGTASDDLAGIRTRSVRAPRFLRRLFYFLWFPGFARTFAPGTIVFSNDMNLLAAALWWRPYVSVPYRVCSDWHMLTGTWKDAYVARRSDALVATSRQLAGKVTAMAGIPLERITVVRGGIDIIPFGAARPAREELGLPEGKLVGYAGFFKTLGKDKGMRLMLDALALLPPDYSMALVGARGRETEEYGAYARERDVTERVRILPEQPFARLAAYEQSMDALAIPYPDEPHFRDYGFPMKVFEYLAAGKPVVYADLPIIAEVMAGRGMPFTPGDAQALAAALQSACTESEAQEIARTNAAEAAQWSWDAKARGIMGALMPGARQA